jgi:hypothetical protein
MKTTKRKKERDLDGNKKVSETSIDIIIIEAETNVLKSGTESNR